MATHPHQRNRNWQTISGNPIQVAKAAFKEVAKNKAVISVGDSELKMIPLFFPLCKTAKESSIHCIEIP